MDRVTQQIAVGAEQGASLSAEITSQSSTLKVMVARLTEMVHDTEPRS
jgi:hypothetical protein